MAQLLWDIMWGKETVIKELCQRKATLNVYFSSPDYRRKIKYYKWGNLTKWIYYLGLTPKEPVILKETLSQIAFKKYEIKMYCRSVCLKLYK